MINAVVLMGRLTYEPELRTTPSGLSVCQFQIAVDRNYSSKDEERKADFIDCVAWRSKAEFLNKYFHKGSMVALEGSLQTENYTDKDGNNRKSVSVVVKEISFCGGKSESGNNGKGNQYKQPVPTYASVDNSDFEEIVDDDDDLPF